MKTISKQEIDRDLISLRDSWRAQLGNDLEDIIWLERRLRIKRERAQRLQELLAETFDEANQG